MQVRLLIIALLTIGTLGLLAGHALSQSGADESSTPAPAMPSPEEKMFEEDAKIIQPSAKHKVLERFLGTWEQTTHIWMMGPQGKATEVKGEVVNTWLVEDLWMIGESTGGKSGNPIIDAMLPTQSFTIMGYDNYKKKFVTVHVQDKSTAMVTGFGNLTRDGNTLISYGTIDQPLTGEHDKMVKYIYRFHDADHIVLEIHDLAIGEQNTKVVEMEFRRKPLTTGVPGNPR